MRKPGLLYAPPDERGNHIQVTSLHRSLFLGDSIFKPNTVGSPSLYLTIPTWFRVYLARPDFPSHPL